MKQKISIRICSIFLSLLMVVTILPLGAFSASAASFTPRLTAPSKSGWYANYSRNNCGAYAQCRINEIVGKYMITRTGPSSIATELRNNGYSSGKVPKEGAVAINSGHIAIVEKIENGKVFMSEGHYAFPYVNDPTTTDLGNSYQNTVRIGPGNTAQWGSANGKSGYGTWFTLRRYDNYSSFTFYYLIDSGGTISNPPRENGSSTTNNTYYNTNDKSKTVGTYKNTCNSGVNMRNSAGVKAGNKIGCTVPNNAEVYVYDIDCNWGKTTYAGRTGWVCLDYFTKISIPVPGTPSISNISSENIAVSKSITINWNAVSGADSYTIGIRSAHVSQDINVGNTTSYSYTLSNAEKYSFYVKASNVSGTSGWSASRSSTAHSPVTVSFVDWDDTPLGTQTINYGSDASAPSAPQRKGYTFQGWNGSFYNVTKDITIKATYKINTYIVNFFDRTGNTIKSEKVEFGKNATPPTNTNETGKYKFLGWNSTDYLNVYTDRQDKNINIDGIYTWYNDDLPAVCTIQSATREYDGYKVIVDIENNDSVPTSGRMVAALKTAEGKLVDMTESTAFSIPAGKIKSGIEIFIPCKKAATSIEVFMVNDYSSGVPISPFVSTKIKEGLLYAESTVKPDNSSGALDIQEITQYSYRDKEFSTGNTKTKDGWTWDETKNTTLVNQTGYQDSVLSTYDNEIEKRVLLGTQNVPVYGNTWGYVYYHFHKRGGGSHTYCPTNHAGGAYHGYYYSTSPFTWSKKSSCGNRDMYTGPACDQCGASAYWWYNAGDSKTITVQTGTKTQYNYATYQYSYNFYRWKAWSDWSDTQVSANNNRDVKTRTVYRYKSNRVQAEDNTGKQRTITGKLDSSFAGKQITLYVYGYTGASDYTNQYIGQSVVANDGSYSFTFRLREEPTAKTGDFTVAIGIEGTNKRTVIDTIEAPKPTFEVKFYNWDGELLDTQIVKEGGNAVLPKNPERVGYDFIGWDKSVSNIRENTEFRAEFKRKEYTVVFVDWKNQQVEIKQFNHGDVLVPPEAKNVDGYTFTGWDNASAVVTQNMVVTAQYEANEYTIKFYDWDNNVIDTQKVKYGETAVVPDDPEAEGVHFVNWLNAADYQYVCYDAAIYPEYYYDETASVVTANYYTGEYNNNIRLELSTSEKDADIYYYLNDDEADKQLYTKPINVDKTCSVTYYASEDGKNDSDTVTEYYCINTPENKNYHIVYVDIYGTVLLVEEGKTIDVTKLDNVEGYDFVGLYSDEKLTNKFNPSTPINESITVFTKYSPKKYTVTFKMQDGTELDVQTVEYMQPATAPDVDSIPGYVFGGWDKEFDCITEDTVITGRFTASSESTANLAAPKAKAVVNANGGFTISWNKISGADKYDVYYDNGTGYKLLRTVTGTSTTTGTAPYGKKYSYKVRAVNSKNSAVTSAFSTAVTATNTKKLQTPTAKAVVNANGGFTISWNKISGADKYDVYYDNGTGYKLLRTVTGTSTTTGTAPYGKKYSYKVRAVNSKNSAVTSAFSAAVTAINNKKLQTPTLKATVNANGSFKLSWNKVTGATRYGIYMLESNGKYKWIKSTSATSWTTGTAQYGKKYTYKVFAVNDNTSAKSAFSSAVSATNNKKLQSTTAKVTVNANGSFKISWNKVTGATKYGIYMKQSNGSYKWIKTVTGTSWSTAVAAYGKQYTYKVLAANNNKSAQTFSNVVNAKNTKKLQTPTLKVAVNKNGSFKLSWGKVTGATSYQIYMKQSNGTYKLIKTTSSTSFTTAVAAKGKTYSYKVRAVTSKNKNATSNYSNVVSVKRK